MIGIFLAALVATAVALPDFRIVGGSTATPNSHPYIGSLQGKSGSGWYHSCGASLVSTEWAVTAAHCVDGVNRNSMRLQFGKHSLSTSGEVGEQTSLISIITLHSEWNSNGPGYPNDIAMLKLTSPATETDQVKTITPAPVGNVYDGQMVTIAGWGRLVGGGASPDRLQQLHIMQIPEEECVSRWSGSSGVAVLESHICIFDVLENTSACHGDSGGPMVASTGELIGVTSWGTPSCDGTLPTVYTRVSYFDSWIKSFTG